MDGFTTEVVQCNTYSLRKMLKSRKAHLVPVDPNGFIKERQAFYSIRCVLNIIHAGKDAPDTTILSLGVKKRFRASGIVAPM